ncbi:hypothetical protein COCOBI_16-4540 [Coccomyxa sp. Obi]|nr:hypothetical protein COCOBI_16-4540 [Coccomyxa sp. Obi]
MDYLTSSWHRRGKGTGDLDDLEAILSAPPPALGEPLRRNSLRSAGCPSAHQGSLTTGHAEASATSTARSGTVAVPPLALTDAHREGPRISPKSEVRCSITRAVVSPRSSDIAAAIQYRPGPAALAGSAPTEQRPACRQGSTSRESVEETSAPFADTLSNFRGMGSSAASERITGWLPIHRKAGSAGNTGVQGPQSHAHDTIKLPLLGTYEKMTVAASLVGAVAGGAAAGPLGVSLGAKSGALMVAAGAGICGAAQHCYAHGLSVAGVGTSLPGIGTGLFSSVPGMRTRARTTDAQDSTASSSAASSADPVQPEVGTPEVPDKSSAASEPARDGVSPAADAPASEQSTQSASGWTAALAGLGSSLWPARTAAKGVQTPPAGDLLEPEGSTAAEDGLPTSCSASQQLTPRRSSEGSQA